MAPILLDPLRQPPLILAIENSGMCGSVALVSGGHCIAEQSLFSRLTHSKRLLHTIERVMHESGVEWPQLGAIAISLGPGSFTGLRIGLSTVKGLSFAASIPLIGVPTLDALACQLEYTGKFVCPIIDARKQEVYTAFYRSDKKGVMRRQSDYLVISAENLAKMIHEPTIFVGDGIAVHGELLRERLGEQAVFAPDHLYFARASAVGFLALAYWRQKEFLNPASCTPLYVRASDAEINLLAKK